MTHLFHLTELKTVSAVPTVKFHSQLKAHSRHFMNSHVLTCFLGIKNRYLPDNLLELKIKVYETDNEKMYMAAQVIMISFHLLVPYFLTN